MEKGFYHPTVGYWQTISDPSEQKLSNYPQGTIEVPIQPGPGYQFDGSKWVAPTSEWLYNTKADEVRVIRNTKLKKFVDPIVSNPLRWTGMTADQQKAIADYRQALLDISSQPGFPDNVVWPEQP